MATNDHFLKWNYPSAFTGKLSDLTGLFFFPLFLCALVCLPLNMVNRTRFFWITRELLIASIAFTAVLFATVKMVTPFTQLYISTLKYAGIVATVTRDPSDLWTLLVLPLTYLFGRRFTEEE